VSRAARSSIPGFKSVKQAEENARALEFGSLTPAQMNEIA
jgi:aryl-alcohol dehydrogenase-like predicted oxidoreductase